MKRGEAIMNGLEVMKGCAAGCFTVLTAFLGGWDKPLYAMVMFIVLDYFFGVIVAAMAGNLSHETGLKGIVRKLGMLCLVGMAHMLDQLLFPDPILRTMTIFLLIANEGQSILRHLSDLGVPIPDKMRSILKDMKEAENHE